MTNISNALRQLLDTITFDSLSSENYKLQTRANWTDVPCGSNYSDSEPLTKTYFDEIETHRYHTHPWIMEAIESFELEGKKVLEIGFGIGTDHLLLARRGARLHGIDLTPRNLEITKARSRLNGMQTELITGDAENLPYQDKRFDFVYCFGVVHHSPDTQRIISEIYRILKHGGKCYVTAYHKNSVFFWWTVFVVNYVLRKGWKKRTLQQQISLIEHPNKNENMVLRLFTKDEYHQMFQKFRQVRSCVKHLLPIDIEYFSSFYRNKDGPSRLLTKVGNKFGWYVIAEAVK